MQRTLKVGDWLLDNDPRKGGRRVQVVAIYTDPKDNKQYAVWKGRRTNRISFDRIHPINQQDKRANGWTLVEGTV